MDSEASLVLDELPGMVWTALPDGSMEFVNERWREFTGLTVDAARGSGWEITVFPQDLSAVREFWRSIRSTCQAGEVEARLLRQDGERRWFLMRARPSTDAYGRIVRWYGINTDIDAMRSAVASPADPWWLSAQGREDQFRSILDGLPVLISLVRPTGEIECANSHYLDFFGLTLAELRSRAPGHGIHPRDEPAVRAAWHASVAASEAYDLQLRRRSGDGTYRWFNSRGFPLRDAAGTIVFWYFLQIDIDELKRSGALLQGEKKLLEMVASGEPMHTVLGALCEFIESTVDGCQCSVVLSDERGTQLEQAVGPGLPRDFVDTIGESVVADRKGPCGTAIAMNQQIHSSDFATETRWTDSGWRDSAIAHGLRACLSTPIPSAAGRLLGAFTLYYNEPREASAQDRSLVDQFTNIASIAIERAQRDAAVRRSEALLAKGQQLSHTGTFLWRVATDEINWSSETNRIFGFDEGVAITLDLIASRVHPEDLPMFANMIARSQANASGFEYEHRLLMPDGSVKYLHMLAHATRDDHGRLEYIGAVQDVTERRSSEDALGKARSDLAHMARVTSLGALTASIAHEVNQPLSGIITNASTCLRMLAADPPNIAGARETARRTIRDGNRASEVIKRLRALFTKKEPTPESVDLNEATREVIALARRELQSSGVILRPELNDALPAVTGDRVQLQQVILNLLLNASDAMRSVEDRPRNLLIRTHCSDDDVILAVSDAGVGLGAHGADKVFDAFYTTKSNGMGIGLSVSRSIIDNHHGRLWAAPNDGPGATFSFSLPRRAGGNPGRRSRSVSTSAIPAPQHVSRPS